MDDRDRQLAQLLSEDIEDSDDDYPARLPPHWNRHPHIHHIRPWEVAVALCGLAIIAAAWVWL